MKNLIAISGKIGSGKDLTGKILQVLSNKSRSFDGMDVITEEDIDYKIWDVPKYEIKKFADKLKEITCLLIGCTREQLEDREFKEKPLGEEWWCYGAYQHAFPKDQLKGIFTTKKEASYILEYSKMNSVELVKLTPRKILQLLGTEAGREIIHPQIWVNALFADFKSSRAGENGFSEYDYGDFKVHQKDHPAFEPEAFPKWIITDCRFPNEAEAVKKRGGFLLRLERENSDTGDHLSEIALDDYEKWDAVIENNGTIKDLVEKIKELNIV